MEDQLSSLRGAAISWGDQAISSQDLLQLAAPLWRPPKEHQLELLRLIREQRLRPLLPLMSRALRDKNAAVRGAALECISSCLERSLSDEVAALLEDRVKEVRLAALRTLSQLKVPRSIAKIAPLLHDEELQVSAIYALGALCTVDNARPIIDALRSPSVEVQRGAIWALVSIEHNEKAGLLLPLLRKRETREDANRALCSLYHPDTIPSLERLTESEDEDLKQAASRVLSTWKSKASSESSTAAEVSPADAEEPPAAEVSDTKAEALKAIVRDEGADTRTRTNALRELGHLCALQHVDFIASFLSHGNEDLRMHAAFALRDTAPQMRLREILSRLDDPSGGCRWALLCALQETYQIEELPRVAAMISDDDERVRAQVCELIGEWRATSYAPLLREQLREKDNDSEEPLNALLKIEDTHCKEEILMRLQAPGGSWDRSALGAAGDLAIKESARFLRVKTWSGDEIATLSLAKLGVAYDDLRGEITEELTEIFQYRRLSQKAGRAALLGLVWLGVAEKSDTLALLRWLREPTKRFEGYFIKGALCDGLFQHNNKALHQRLRARLPAFTPRDEEELRGFFQGHGVPLITKQSDWRAKRSAAPDTSLQWLLEDYFYPNTKFADGDSLLLLSEEEALKRWEERLS